MSVESCEREVEYSKLWSLLAFHSSRILSFCFVTASASFYRPQTALQHLNQAGMSAPLELTLGIIKPSVTAHQPHVQGQIARSTQIQTIADNLGVYRYHASD